MALVPTSRAGWVIFLAVIIAVGVLSRIARTGFVLVDKYLGDMLYAAMVYAIVRLWRTPRTAAAWSVAAMIVIESFQLTLIAAHMLNSDQLAVRITARLMGTHFSLLDLLAYFIAIGGLYIFDKRGHCAGRRVV